MISCKIKCSNRLVQLCRKHTYKIKLLHKLKLIKTEFGCSVLVTTVTNLEWFLTIAAVIKCMILLNSALYVCDTL